MKKWNWVMAGMAAALAFVAAVPSLPVHATNFTFSWPCHTTTEISQGPDITSAVNAALAVGNVNNPACVGIDAGIWYLSGKILRTPGSEIAGVSNSQTTIQPCTTSSCGKNYTANPGDAAFDGNGVRCESVAGPTCEYIGDLKIDGQNTFFYDVFGDGTRMERVSLTGAYGSSDCQNASLKACGQAIGLNDMGMDLRDSFLNNNYGGGIYMDPGTNHATDGSLGVNEGPMSIVNTQIENNGFRAIDANQVSGNANYLITLSGDTISGNYHTDSAVNLYEASYWNISSSTISMDNAGGVVSGGAHPFCTGQAVDDNPGGAHTAGVKVCQDGSFTDDTHYTDSDGLGDNDPGNEANAMNDVITGSTITGYYGILSLGGDDVNQWFHSSNTPRGNTFTNDNVFGSNIGCTDDYEAGGSLADNWSGTNCGGPITY